MSTEWFGLIGMLTMLLLMFLRIPISIAMAVPAFLGIWFLKGWEPLVTVIESIIWEQANSYSLVVIPLFVLMGEVLYVSGVTGDLFTTFRNWFGKLRGGLGIATISASAVFAAASGSSIATTGTMGTVSSKEMIKAGYNKTFIGGSIIAGGTLGVLIPPSTLAIIYGTLTETSIAGLLLAIIIPGLLLTFLYILTMFIMVIIRPDLAESGESVSWKERFRSLNNTVPVFLLFLLTIGGMYLGIFGPTEAAAVGASGAMLIVLVKRKLNKHTLFEALVRTVETTGFLFAVMLIAFILNYFFTITRLPMLIGSFIDGLNLTAGTTFLLIILMYLVLGCVMDTMAMIIVTMPIVVPIMLSYGFDLIWFGVVIIVVVEMAMITPPVGMNCFVLKGAAPELQLSNIFKGALIFLIPIFTLIGLLYFIPEIALFLPNTMR